MTPAQAGQAGVVHDLRRPNHLQTTQAPNEQQGNLFATNERGLIARPISQNFGLLRPSNTWGQQSLDGRDDRGSRFAAPPGRRPRRCPAPIWPAPPGRGPNTAARGSQERIVSDGCGFASIRDQVNRREKRGQPRQADLIMGSEPTVSASAESCVARDDRGWLSLSIRADR